MHTAPRALRSLRAPGCSIPRRTALSIDPGTYAAVPCWWSAEKWISQIRLAYLTRYVPVRARLLRSHGGGGISLTTLISVAAAMAAAADFRTGRDSRLSNATLGKRTGLCIKTVQRARFVLARLGLATEVLRGRQRTRSERMGSWRVGDKARGWASVWALHAPPRPVDNSGGLPAGQGQMSPHPRRGSFKHLVLPSSGKTTDKPVDKSASKGLGDRGRDPDGVVLARQWLADPLTPRWAHRHTPYGWARALAGAADHGWCARDLNQGLRDWQLMGHWVPDDPYRPIGLIGKMLTVLGLNERPAMVEMVRDQERVERAARAQTRRRVIAECQHCDEYGWVLPYGDTAVRCPHCK